MSIHMCKILFKSVQVCCKIVIAKCLRGGTFCGHSVDVPAYRVEINFTLLDIAVRRCFYALPTSRQLYVTDLYPAL